MRDRELGYLLGTRFRRLSWTEWGDAGAPIVICVHGLTRTGRDFDPLAEALADRFRVVCPDLPGRGRSEWLDDAAAYQPATYLQALSHLLAAVGGSPDHPVGWVGTSLGGILGMIVAAAEGQPIGRLILNDIGTHISAAALARIATYMAGAPTEFADLAALDAHLRQVHAPFGRLTDPQWAHLARTSARALPNGRLALHYDPNVTAAVLAGPVVDVDLFPIWRRIAIPRMVIRGVDSDLLDRATTTRMQADGATVLEIANAGHAPALMDADSIRAVRDFLSGGRDAS